ncbi:MAG: hypothetical protein JXA09_08100, partial [Anaerolineae bacterium]|nr:hypothetical protein [Anaerolineae bacterium]
RGSMEWNRTGEQQGLGANENAPCDDFVDADGDGVCDLHDGEPNAPQMRGSRAASPGAGRMRQ